MSINVRCLVQTDQPYPVLRLVGDLDEESAQPVCSALVTALAEQPEALIVDVSQLRVTDPVALAALADVALQAADWSITHVVLCDPVGDVATVWDGAGLTACPSTEAAVARLGAPGAAQRLSLELEPAVGAARRARELVTEGCVRWNLPELVGPGCIAVTEMVNNVVQHVKTPMTVYLAARDGALAVAVRDGSDHQPRYGGPVPPTSYGGRGLLLIDSVARRWGTVGVQDGKVVWAVIHAQDEVTGRGRGEPAVGANASAAEPTPGGARPEGGRTA